MVPGMGSWAYRTGPDPGIWTLPSGAEEWTRKLRWCPAVRDSVRYAAQDGQTITKRYAVDVDGQLEVLSLADLSRGASAWGRFTRARGFGGRFLGDVLLNIVTDQAAELPDLTGYPTFRDGRLTIPPTPYLPDGYSNGEESSPRALRALVQALAEYPRAALILGLSAAAPWITPLQLQPFTLHVVGDTTTGKTTAITAASAMWGTGYKGVTATWHGTRLSVPGQLRDLGVLPAFRDELSTAGLSGPDRATMFSVIMEGCKRGARTRDDLPRPSATWGSVLFSTGNIAAVPDQHVSAGHPKGVIELHADGRSPVIPESEKGRIQKLTNDPAMAGSWVPIAKRLSVDGMRAAYEGAAADLGQLGGGGLAWHMWRAMSLGLAGARALSIAVQVPQLAAAAELAAREIINGAGERMAEIRADHGQRMVDTLTEYLSIRPAAFGRGDPRDVTHTDQMGFTATTQDGKDLLCVYPSKHGEIARAAGVEDVTVALRQLRTEGRLIVSKNAGLGYRCRRDGGLLRVYAYSLSGETAVTGMNTPNGPARPSPCPSDQGDSGPERESEQGWPAGSFGATANPGSAAGVVGDEVQALEPALEPGTQDARCCEACGESMKVIEAGQRYHPMCEPESHAEPADPEPAPVAGSPAGAPDSPPVATSGRRDGETSRRKVSDLDTGDELETFTRALHKHDIGTAASEADIAAALELFHQATHGLRWVSYAGQTGQAALARLITAYPSVKAPRALADERAAELAANGRLSVTRFHIRKGARLREGQAWTGYDVNGQYPAAAVSAELGDGDPVWVKPRALSAVWDHPGYARLAEPIRGSHPAIRMIKDDGSAPARGDVLPMPVIKYLGGDLGLKVSADEVCYWPKHGRRLRAYVEHVHHKPKAALLAMPPSPARSIAVAALKVMVNDSIGMFRSEKWSHGCWYRPDWHDQVTALAEMNAFRAVDKCGTKPFAKVADSLYWTAPPPCGACAGDDRPRAERTPRPDPKGHDAACGKPKGLFVSPSQSGWFKLERHGEITPAMIDAYKAGQPRVLHDAAKAADKIRREGGNQ